MPRKGDGAEDRPRDMRQLQRRKGHNNQSHAERQGLVVRERAQGIAKHSRMPKMQQNRQRERQERGGMLDLSWDRRAVGEILKEILKSNRKELEK